MWSKATGPKDTRTGRLRGGDVPAGALADVPCCHTKGVPFALASRTAGRRERKDFFWPMLVVEKGGCEFEG